MTKTIRGREYLYLYKTSWVAGRPKSEYVRYLGPKAGFTEDELRSVLAGVSD
ncbi:MAG: hypothetical protein V1921_03310 [Candidatus Altiarchaeota archaeon]